MIAILVNHLWQSTLFGVAVALLMPLLRKDAARMRYWLWLAASVKFLIPFSIVEAVGGYLGSHVASSIPPSIVAATMAQEIAQPFSPATPALMAAVPGTLGINLVTVLFATWACGFIAVGLLWLVRWLRIAAVLRVSSPLPIDAPIPVKASTSRLEPGLIGIFRPVLLLPEGIAASLTTEELQAIMEHELCHLRRRDNLTAALHMLVEALFWFHPLVWWLGARLMDERERACDEAVVNSGGDPQVYAEGILKVCKLYLQSPLVCAAGVSGADLKTRIEAIMTVRIGIPLNGAKKVLLTCGGLAVVVGPFATGYAMTPQTPAQTAASSASVSSPELIAGRLAEQAKPREQVAIDPKLLDAYSGYYQMAPNLIFTIANGRDHLLTRLTGQVVVDVYPESSTKFFAKVVHAQISFVTDTQGHATELVLHQGGYEQTAKRIDEAAAQRVEAALAKRIKDNTPGPGTEAALRRYIESILRGQPNYQEMAPGLATAVREQLPTIQRFLEKWGTLQSIAFKGVAANGWDVYDVTFAHGQAEWRLAPLDVDGRTTARTFRELP